MTRPIVIALFVVVLIATTGTAPRGDAVVEIMHHGHFYAAPATLSITVAVAPNADNRLLRIEADSDALYRASEVVLDGADAQRLFTMMFRSLPAGTYMVRASVMSASKVRGIAEDQIIVTEGAAR